MKITNVISSSVNQSVTVTSKTINKIVTNPSATKKMLQIINKFIEAVDLIYGRPGQQRALTEAFKGTVVLIDFNTTIKNVVFWINPFSRDSIDQKALWNSVYEILSTEDQLTRDEKVNAIINEIMHPSKDYYNKQQVMDAVINILKEKNYVAKGDNEIARRITIKQKSRSKIQLVSTACFTVAGLGGNLLILKKWNILNLAPIAAQIGGQSRVLLFVFNAGADLAIGTIASAGLILTTGDAFYRFVNILIKYKHMEASTEKEKMYKEVKNALLDLLVNGTDLIATVTPLVFSLNPPLLIAFAVVAKGTGLVVFLIK